jgi:hypothetical protein
MRMRADGGFDFAVSGSVIMYRVSELERRRLSK